MPIVEAFDSKDAAIPLFTAEFDFLPRVGDYLSRNTEGYFKYYNVVEVWNRQDSETDAFRACIRVELND